MYTLTLIGLGLIGGGAAAIITKDLNAEEAFGTGIVLLIIGGFFLYFGPSLLPCFK